MTIKLELKVGDKRWPHSVGSIKFLVIFRQSARKRKVDSRKMTKNFIDPTLRGHLLVITEF